MIIDEGLTLEKKLEILGDAAKYDVACTSSGVDRGGKGFAMGNARAAGICHSFSADGRCISLLKILMTNECCYECRYCINRASNDVVRATFTPEEVARLTIEFYRRNYIEGLFLSSGIYPTPQESAERMLAAIRLLRVRYRFGGYLHVKTIPGADLQTTNEIGWYCDRMSVNLELPTAEGLKQLAPNKTRRNILAPMRFVQNGIRADNGVAQIGTKEDRRALPRAGAGDASDRPPADGALIAAGGRLPPSLRAGMMRRREQDFLPGTSSAYLRPETGMRRFVPAGQSTQMIIGATPESDYALLSVTEQLYHRFDLKRVFFSAFINVNHDSDMPEYAGRMLLDREHRLYQADFLLRYYHFRADDLLSPDRPNFNLLVDPKCDYALRHLELFPVEVNRASYDELLRVPGIGVKSAQRIVAARRSCRLDFPDLKRMGVVLKRAAYFITCGGRLQFSFRMTEDAIVGHLIDDDKRRMLGGEEVNYRQLSLFDLYPNLLRTGAVA